MKENVLDVLMYIFENYLDSDAIPEEPDQETLKAQLMSAGFRDHEVNKAFDWLEGLSALQPSEQQEELPASNLAFRVYAEPEIEKLNQDCRGLIMYLEELGVLTPSSREMVIDRVMALDTVAIDLDQLKWIILMVLFNQPGYEAAYAWMEDLIFNEMPGQLH